MNYVDREEVLQVLQSQIRPVYLPWVCASLAVGVLIPVLPMHLIDQGIGIARTSFVLGGAGAGAAGGALIIGSLLQKFGRAKIAGAALLLLAVAVVSMGSTGDLPLLILCQLLIGTATVGVMLSGQTHLTNSVSGRHRGRAMALMGGSMRLAFLVGPPLGGVLVEYLDFQSTFCVAGFLSALGVLALIPEIREPSEASENEAHKKVGLFTIVRKHRKALVGGGVGGFLVMTVREGRIVILPLIGITLGLGPSAVGALVAAGTAADLFLFPVSGWIMDRYGRLYAWIPAYSLFAIGLCLLAMAKGPELAVVAGVIMGVGNGLSSGSVFTLGSDLAPKDTLGPFLGSMALITDTGRITGPLLVGVVADAAGLGWASLTLASVACAAVFWLLVVVGETGENKKSVDTVR